MMRVEGRVYTHGRATPPSHSYLLPRLESLIDARGLRAGKALDYGCGNGALTGWLAGRGFDAFGVDPSPSGIEVASATCPDVSFSNDISAGNLARNGPFDLALCIEVIAHCFHPVAELRKIHDAMAPGGLFLLSTPFHGYWKFLALALTGSMEQHLDSLWEGGYVHYFSEDSIRQVIGAAGFEDISIQRCGRVAPIAQSMIVACMKPR